MQKCLHQQLQRSFLFLYRILQQVGNHLFHFGSQQHRTLDTYHLQWPERLMQLCRAFLQQCLVFSTDGILFQLHTGKLERLIQLLAYPAQCVVIYCFIHNSCTLPVASNSRSQGCRALRQPQ